VPNAAFRFGELAGFADLAVEAQSVLNFGGTGFEVYIRQDSFHVGIFHMAIPLVTVKFFAEDNRLPLVFGEFAGGGRFAG
jgi:hypothetical protein